MKIKLVLPVILIIGVIAISGCAVSPTTPLSQRGISYSVSKCLGDPWNLTEDQLAKPPYKVTSEVAGGVIKLYKKQAHYCGADIKIEMQKEGNTIKLTESNHAPVAKCMCLYDVNVSLTDFNQNTNKIELWGVKQLATELYPIEKLDEIRVRIMECETKGGYCTGALSMTCKSGYYPILTGESSKLCGYSKGLGCCLPENVTP